MVYFGDNLRCHISWCATESINCLIFWASETESKIDKFQFFMPVNQNIFCFNVSMYDVSAMKVLKSLSNN